MTMIKHNIDDLDDLSLVSAAGSLSDADALWQRPCPEEELSQGTVLGDYVIDSKLGGGGCGIVYLATHRATGQQVAIKILHGHLTFTPKVVTRFLREIEMIELLHHPHIVAIEATGKHEDGRPYFVMEYLGPTTLASICQDQGTLSVKDCVQILDPVCHALAAAHAQGIVHRDIKASNISVQRNENHYVVKLLDFGVAKLNRQETDGTGFTTQGRVIGTLQVMAPEQIRGYEVDFRADIYALGALLYRMLTGRVLFYSNISMEIALRHLEEPAPKPSLIANVPADIDAVVLRCLEKDPAKRFQSVTSFFEALQAAAEQADPKAPASEGELATGFGVYVELQPRENTDELDEDLCDDIQQSLDYAEETLTNAGFSMVLATGSLLLGIRLLSDENSKQIAEERQAQAHVFDMREKLKALAAENDRMAITISARVDKVYVKKGNENRFLGGPLLHTDDWAANPETLLESGPIHRKRDSNAA